VEIRGSEKPDQVVIICVHLDSWDLGTGSTDDVTGVASVLEAARAIKVLGLRPRRTIRIVLFTGEEQGQMGSREYVKQHRAELPKISGVLADDTGSGRLSTIRLNQNFRAHKLVDTALAPMRDLKLTEPGMERFYGSDYGHSMMSAFPAFLVLAVNPITTTPKPTPSTKFEKMASSRQPSHWQVGHTTPLNCPIYFRGIKCWSLPVAGGPAASSGSVPGMVLISAS
jgi:hypothetical protein